MVTPYKMTMKSKYTGLTFAADFETLQIVNQASKP